MTRLIDKLSDEDNKEAVESVGAYLGEHSFVVGKDKVWMLSGDKGVILSGDELMPFVVTKNGEFDVWYEGHFVDFGETYLDTYIVWAVENKLLK